MERGFSHVPFDKLVLGKELRSWGGYKSYRNRELLGGSSQDLDTWLIAMVIVSPLSRVVPLPNSHLCLINGGLPNHLVRMNGLNGLQTGGDPNHLVRTILQVRSFFSRFWISHILIKVWVNKTVQMTEGDMVVITGRNFHGLMDEEVKVLRGLRGGEWRGWLKGG